MSRLQISTCRTREQRLRLVGEVFTCPNGEKTYVFPPRDVCPNKKIAEVNGKPVDELKIEPQNETKEEQFNSVCSRDRR